MTSIVKFLVQVSKGSHSPYIIVDQLKGTKAPEVALFVSEEYDTHQVQRGPNLVASHQHHNPPQLQLLPQDAT